MAEVSSSTAVHSARSDTTETVDGGARRLLREMFDAAIGAADPAKVLAAHLPPRPEGRCVVVGAGKAAASMAAALETAWADVPLTGMVVAPYGYGGQGGRIQVREAGHPVPDANSMAAAEEALQVVAGLKRDDLVIALISGGGSATMCLPLPGLSLDDKRLTNKLLLSSGLDIRTMNAVRRRISGIKGGKLAVAAAPAPVITLAISDIPGDDPAAIASGPTLPPPPDTIDLGEVADRLGVRLPAQVSELLRQPSAPVDAGNAGDVRMIATPARALEAAAAVASRHGLAAVILGDDIEGESACVARDMARLIDAYDKPTVLISGGETTVTLGDSGAGRGGRNTEFALALADELDGRADVWALAGDTDGEDGANLGAAGAIIAPDTIARARALGLDPRASLHGHDSGSLFEALGDLVVTGPTRTNVNDFRAILVLPAASF